MYSSVLLHHTPAAGACCLRCTATCRPEPATLRSPCHTWPFAGCHQPWFWLHRNLLVTGSWLAGCFGGRTICQLGKQGWAWREDHQGQGKLKLIFLTAAISFRTFLRCQIVHIWRSGGTAAMDSAGTSFSISTTAALWQVLLHSRQHSVFRPSIRAQQYQQRVDQS